MASNHNHNQNQPQTTVNQLSLVDNWRLLSTIPAALRPTTSGNGGSGLSEITIMKNLQVITLKTKIGGKCEGEKEEIDTCAICYSEYEENKKIGKLQCGHLFHVDQGRS